MLLHPQIIEKHGQKEFAVIPYHEFMIIQQQLEDYEDLCILRKEKAEASQEPTRSFDDVLKGIMHVS